RHNESVFVFAKQTTAINNRLNDSLSAITASVTTVTDNTYSAFGYASRIFSTTTGDGNTYTAETLHDYYGSPSDWLWRGRGRETVTTHQVNGQNDGNNTRTTQYFYNSLGLLEREVAEPNDPALTQSVAYAYDQYGNTVETTVCEGGACQADPA